MAIKLFGFTLGRKDQAKEQPSEEKKPEDNEKK